MIGWADLLLAALATYYLALSVSRTVTKLK